MTTTLPTFQPAPATRGDDTGFGVLNTASGCLPLTDMNVSSKISGLTFETTVSQTFINTLSSALEATYIFPLPDRAAVTSFEFKVRDRVINGVLKERGQARQEYQQAIQQGKQAAMAEEDRSGVFTMQVGNLPAGEQATVVLKMTGPLEIISGEAEFRFPLVVASRFTEGAPLSGPPAGAGTAADTGQAPDASRVTPPVLLAGMPNPVRLTLETEIDAAGRPPGGNWKQQVRSSLHTVVVSDDGPLRVKLEPGERLNRDFILRLPACQQEVAASFQLSPSVSDGDTKKPGVMAVTLTPPHIPAAVSTPRDIVFLLDRSGSMGGWKMVAARRALARMVDTLGENDRFSVIAFDNVLEQPPVAVCNDNTPQLIPAGNRQRWRTLEWLGKVDARGGTEMSIALTAGLALLEGGGESRTKQLVLVTDGQVTAEDMLLRTIADSSVKPRVYAVGIDRAVNAGFLRRLAAATDGQADFVESEDRIDDAMEAMHRQLGDPVLTNVQLEPAGFDCIENSQAPVRIPDLFPGRAVTVYARHLCTSGGRLKVTATTAAGEPWSTELQTTAADCPSLLHFWGRQKVRELEDSYAISGDQALRSQIVEASLEAGVLSRFTAFVAVDHSEVVNEGGIRQKIVQPVEQVDGWQQTFGGMAAGGSSMALRSSGNARRKMSRKMSPPAPQAISLQTEAHGGGSDMSYDMDCDAPESTLDAMECAPAPMLEAKPPATPPTKPSAEVPQKKRKVSAPAPTGKPSTWQATLQKLIAVLAENSSGHWRDAANWSDVQRLLKHLLKQLTAAGHQGCPQVEQTVSEVDTCVSSSSTQANRWDELHTAVTTLLTQLAEPDAAKKEFWT